MKTGRPVMPCAKHPESDIYLATKRCVGCTLEDAAAVPWQIATQEEAVEKGHRKYWTGKTCVNGHIKQRYTASGICIGCNAMNSAKRVKRIRSELTARQKGLVSVSLMLHPDDAKAVRDYAAILASTRGPR